MRWSVNLFPYSRHFGLGIGFARRGRYFRCDDGLANGRERQARELDVLDAKGDADGAPRPPGRGTPSDRGTP